MKNFLTLLLNLIGIIGLGLLALIYFYLEKDSAALLAMIYMKLQYGPAFKMDASVSIKKKDH